MPDRFSLGKSRKIPKTEQLEQAGKRQIFYASLLYTYNLRKWDLCQPETWQLPTVVLQLYLHHPGLFFSPPPHISLIIHSLTSLGDHSSVKARAEVNWLWCIFRCERSSSRKQQREENPWGWYAFFKALIQINTEMKPFILENFKYLQE